MKREREYLPTNFFQNRIKNYEVHGSEIYKVVITPEAQNNIRSIVLCIASILSAPQSALALNNTYQKTITSLSMLPERIKIIDDHPWKDKDIRKVRVKNHFIYFVISGPDNTVRILAVIYTGRDQQQVIYGSIRISDEE